MNLSEQLKHEVLIASAQNSKAWDVIRLGRFTGSGLSNLFVKGTRPMTKEELESRDKKNKRTTVDVEFGATAMTYIETKAMEYITQVPIGDFSSKYTDWGNEWEETAIMETAKAVGCDESDLQMKPNFVLYENYSGASPDAYMIVDGVRCGAEVKCPYNSVYHYHHTKITDAETLKEVNEDYYWQIQANMYFNKMPLWIFASFDPRQPAHRRLHVAHIYAVPEDIELMLQKLEQAEAMKQEIIKNWMSK